MKTSAKGVAFVAAHEGITTKAYRDVKGVRTIGVGHTAAAGPPAPKAGMTITREQALALLARDLPKYEGGVARRMGLVAQHVFDGAVSFHFNTGGIGRASWVGRLLDGLYVVAEASLKSWNKSGGRIYKGLVRRRAEEADVIFRNKYPAGLDAVALPDAPPAPDNPAASADRREVESYQQALATLGFYKGKIDGVPGPLTRAAVVAYQKSHPDLIDDGVVGPATRAQLERDLAAKGGGFGSAAASGAAVAAASAGAAAELGGDPLLWAIAAGVVGTIGVLGFFAWRYRAERKRLAG